MQDLIKERDKALKKARGFARSGMGYFAQLWIDRANSFWLVSGRQVRNVSKLLDEYRYTHFHEFRKEPNVKRSSKNINRSEDT